jgi:hypothetical protein
MLQSESTIGSAPCAQFFGGISNVAGSGAGRLRQVFERLLDDGCQQVVQAGEVQVHRWSANANLSGERTQRKLARARLLDR